jgi:hypothetical protein
MRRALVTCALVLLVVTTPVSAAPTDSAPAGVGAALSAPGRLELVTVDVDGSVLLKWWDGNQSTPWTSIGGIATSDPDIAGRTYDSLYLGVPVKVTRIDVVARGADGAIWHNSRHDEYTTQGPFDVWTGWTSLGGAAKSAPTIITWESGRLDVFAWGLDDQLWGNYWINGWAGWYPLGGILTSAPEATTRGSNIIDIFARGADGAVWQKTWNGTAFEGWASLGGDILFSPAAASSRSDRIDVAAVGTDGQVWLNGWDEPAGAWGGWVPSDLSAPALMASAPELSSPAEGRLYIFGRGLDGQVWSKLYGDGVNGGWAPIG